MDIPSQTLALPVPSELVEHLAERVAELLETGRDDGFLDTEEAAEYLGLSRKAVYRLVERGQLPHHRVGGRLLFDKAALRAWVQR